MTKKKIKPDIVFENGAEIYFTPSGKNYFYDEFIGADMNLQKENAWRCKKYTDWVKTQPSVVSGEQAQDPHHLKGHGFSGSVKAPDWAVIPLTSEEHSELHHIGFKAWEEVNGSQLDLLMRFWRQNFGTIKEFM